jgi:beta-fructofuranosidase
VTLRLPGHWLWDFWFARDGEDVHVFYLQAPRPLGDPELRHRNATIGHAVSRDLRRWRVLPDALGPGAPGEFDDLATWTGSVLRHDGRWHLFYTGISRAEDGRVQRIGLAISEDLVAWERQGVLLEADLRWYGREHWRDPWVDRDEEGGRFDMLICAKVDGRGVVGHAVSRDLRGWQAQPPLSPPGAHFHLEVPQLVRLDGAWRLVFSDDTTGCGIHYLTAGERLGPYPADSRELLPRARPRRHYAGRLLEHRGEWLLFTWLMDDEHGVFVGALSDPMPLPRPLHTPA